MADPLDPRERLRRLLADGDDRFDLAEAALLVAAQEYAGLVVRVYLGALDDLADSASPWVESAAAVGRWSDGLSRFLFAEAGFRGSLEYLDDPRNSYLNEVLDRRTGLPITLSLVYLEVASRLGRHAEGVGLPGHFIVRVWEGDEPLLIDPFNGGVQLTEDDCRARVQQLYGSAREFKAEFLHAVGNREVLARILRNLKRTYLGLGDSERALRAVDALLLVTPAVAHEQRDRGLLHLRLGHLQAAKVDLEAYLESGSAVGESGRIRELADRAAAFWERRN